MEWRESLNQVHVQACEEVGALFSSVRFGLQVRSKALPPERALESRFVRA